MRRISLLLGCLATTTVACSSSKEPNEAAKAAPAAAPTAAAAPAAPAASAASAPAAAPAAGRVLEVSGTVTVAGKPLAVGDTVVADAIIETGPDSSVSIELVHNLARWDLGPNKHVRVDQSLAWKEPKHEGAVAQIDQETTSAGQPAERMAAGTTTSAIDKGILGGKGLKDLGSGSNAIGGLGIKGTGPGGGGTGDGIGIGQIGTLGHGGGTGTGTGYGKGAGGLGGGGTRGSNTVVRQEPPQVMGQLAPEIITRVVKMHLPQVRLCYQKALQADPTLKGKITIKFVITKDGNVATATVASDTLGDGKVGQCITAAVIKWTFPAPKEGIVIAQYPFLFVSE